MTVVCKCGSKLFLESVPVMGQWTRMMDGDGEIDSTDLSGVRYGKTPKTVVCAECQRRCPNPRHSGTREEAPDV